MTLNNLNGTNVPPGFPSLRQAQEPRIIRLCEVSTDGSFPQILPDAKNRGEHRDWLPILVKEALGVSHEGSHDLEYSMRVLGSLTSVRAMLQWISST